jgi:hypothetical protein
MSVKCLFLSDGCKRSGVFVALNLVLEKMKMDDENCRYFTIEKDPVYSSRTPVSIKHLVS